MNIIIFHKKVFCNSFYIFWILKKLMQKHYFSIFFFNFVFWPTKYVAIDAFMTSCLTKTVCPKELFITY